MHLYFRAILRPRATGFENGESPSIAAFPEISRQPLTPAFLGTSFVRFFREVTTRHTLVPVYGLPVGFRGSGLGVEVRSFLKKALLSNQSAAPSCSATRHGCARSEEACARDIQRHRPCCARATVRSLLRQSQADEYERSVDRKKASWIATPFVCHGRCGGIQYERGRRYGTDADG